MTTQDPIAGLFKKGPQEQRILTILDRATERRVAQSMRGAQTILIQTNVETNRKALKFELGQILAKALTLRNGSKGNASIRMSAPDTGGRSFHFAHYTVSKGDTFRAAPKSKGVGATRGMTSAAAHLAYIERQSAVERRGEEIQDEKGDQERAVAYLTLEEAQAILDRPRGKGRPGVAAVAERQAALEAIQEITAGRDVGGKAKALVRAAAKQGATQAGIEAEGYERSLDDPGRTGAAQTYIENPAKMRNGEVILSSFGNIGETHEQRLRFWEELEEHEPMPNARIQNRIICELPHQSTPEARKEILEAFVKPFDEKGIPYHVAVHAPGKDNDARNFHAHIVFSERPAKMMAHPVTKEQVWDFTVVETTTDRHRNTREKHTYRQKRDAELRKISAVRDMRKRFAEAVTTAMAPIDASVKFDPRSYKDMGLDVDPMRTVNRVLHDRMRDGKLVIQDAQWTKRMVAAEIRAAAQRRDPDVARLFETTKAMEAIRSAFPNVAEINKHLSQRSKLKTLGYFTKSTFTRIVNQRIALEHERLRERVVAKAEMEVCNRVIDASKPIDVKGPNRKEVRLPEDVAALRILHEAASEEREAIREKMKAAERRLLGLIADNRAAWKSTAQAPMFEDAYKTAKQDDVGKRGPKAKTSAADAFRAPPRYEPAPKEPEKPDPVTGKVRFEPDFVVAERLKAAKGDASSKTRPASRPHAALEDEAEASKNARTASSTRTPGVKTMPAALEAEAAARAARTTPTAGAAKEAPKYLVPTMEQATDLAAGKLPIGKTTGRASAREAEISAMMKAMWDPTLRGQEVADMVDAFWREYGGKPERAKPGQTGAPPERSEKDIGFTVEPKGAKTSPAPTTPAPSRPPADVAREPRTRETMGFTVGPIEATAQATPAPAAAATAPAGRRPVPDWSDMIEAPSPAARSAEVQNTAKTGVEIVEPIAKFASTPMELDALTVRRAIPDWSDVNAAEPAKPPEVQTSKAASDTGTPMIAPTISAANVISAKTPSETVQAMPAMQTPGRPRTEPIAWTLEEVSIEPDPIGTRPITPAIGIREVKDALRRVRAEATVIPPQAEAPAVSAITVISANESVVTTYSTALNVDVIATQQIANSELADAATMEAKRKKDRRRRVILMRKPGGKTR